MTPGAVPGVAAGVALVVFDFAMTALLGLVVRNTTVTARLT